MLLHWLALLLVVFLASLCLVLLLMVLLADLLTELLPKLHFQLKTRERGEPQREQPQLCQRCQTQTLSEVPLQAHSRSSTQRTHPPT